MNMALHFSSNKPDWGTPQDFFDRMNQLHGPFTLDVCAAAENAKCDKYFDERINGLAQSWGTNICWMNPPYGREISKWIKKAFHESRLGAKVVCLVPARTDTAWWHDYCVKGAITFLRGRLTFEGAPHPAPFPSAIVIFHPGAIRSTKLLESPE